MDRVENSTGLGEFLERETAMRRVEELIESSMGSVVARLGPISSGQGETIMCGRVRLSSDYSEIKIQLKFAPNSVAPNFEPDFRAIWLPNSSTFRATSHASRWGQLKSRVAKWQRRVHSRPRAGSLE